jgi:hypothetical protein
MPQGLAEAVFHFANLKKIQKTLKIPETEQRLLGAAKACT